MFIFTHTYLSVYRFSLFHICPYLSVIILCHPLLSPVACVQSTLHHRRQSIVLGFHDNAYYPESNSIIKRKIHVGLYVIFLVVPFAQCNERWIRRRRWPLLVGGEGGGDVILFYLIQSKTRSREYVLNIACKPMRPSIFNSRMKPTWLTYNRYDYIQCSSSGRSHCLFISSYEGSI